MIAPTVRPINMTDPFTEVTSREETDGDISRLGKSLNPEVELEEERNRASEDVKSKEMIENISSWKSRYFTVLGFFLVFLAIFLVVIVRRFRISRVKHFAANRRWWRPIFQSNRRRSIFESRWWRNVSR